MTSSVFATQLMKTEWWAAADRISQYKWLARPHEACGMHSPGMNNNVTIAYAEGVFLPSVFLTGLNRV